MARDKLDSVSDHVRHGYNLRITCLGCQYIIDARADEMLMKVSRLKGRPDIEDLEYRMKCSDCGHRGASIMPVIAEY